jgi:NAD(P)-dependent dehydrogenase (short-subunit alcohol dehydrogenase family)
MTTPSFDTRTWIITGATAGLGRALAVAALAAGENVVGTARRVERFAELTQRFPDRLDVIDHDVRDTARADEVVDRALNRFGRVDVLVNNAGVGQVGAAEEVTDEQLRDMLAQHLFGPAALTRAVLPHLRSRGSGSIVQMSSQGGRRSFPGVGSYSAGKFALEGWSEALAGEIRPLGINVLIVEPSRFRTEFNSPDVLRMSNPNAAYHDVVGVVRANMTNSDGMQEGDPARGANIIRQVLESADVPLRLPLGAEAVKSLTSAYAASLDNVRQWADISSSADFPDMAPAERPF